MPIQVICPGCHKRFKVGDQHAGKSGACPKCKTAIKVPTKAEEVQVHAPTEFAGGGQTTTGELITKPIARKEHRIEPIWAVAVAGAVLTALLVTWASGGLIRGNLAVRALGLLLVSPPLVVAAYAFLRDEDLAPHQGKSLYIRTAICSVAYVILWGTYGYAANSLLTGELWQWVFVIPPFLGTGALVAMGCLDLDFGSGFFHYCFYLIFTVLLRWVAGMGWVWAVTEAVLQ